MAKVAQQIYFDIGDFEALDEIRSLCKFKSTSQAIHFVMLRYKKLEEEQRNLRNLVAEHKKSDEKNKKPVNPMVNPWK